MEGFKMVLLSQKEVESMMSMLTNEQATFLNYRMKRKKKSQWLQTLATYKGIELNENMSQKEMEAKMDDWILVDILDGGFKKRPYKCDCGQSVRFQYKIKNNHERTVRYLGVNCFESYLSLPSAVIRDVKSGMYAIDVERDEMLVKYRKNLFFPLTSYLHLSLPQDMIDQYNVGLPLTDNQIELVKRIHTRYEEEKKLSHLFQRLSIDQQQFILKMSQGDRRELLLLTEDGLAESLFPDEDFPEYDWFTQKQVELGLPLLKRQQQNIDNQKSGKLPLNLNM